ncbi:hypothetical protein BDQ17DRAFT_1434348 [Cyathus striatus]|nr:hypothetical protein BDQ17DRAFT_1434348 [Cyathus striatus]
MLPPCHNHPSTITLPLLPQALPSSSVSPLLSPLLFHLSSSSASPPPSSLPPIPTTQQAHTRETKGSDGDNKGVVHTSACMLMRTSARMVSSSPMSYPQHITHCPHPSPCIMMMMTTHATTPVPPSALQ